jgi:spore coat protein H
MNTNATSTHVLNALRHLTIACTTFLTVSLSWGQDYVPDLGTAFLADEVATVRLTLAAEDLDFILNPDNAYSNVEWPGTFVYESSLGIDTVTNVGIRLRGNTSRTAGKKSFKVSFNTFTTGGKWNDLEKLNLNGNHNDPSMLRARMVWDYMREQGYVAPRISHVKLYINEEYRGLYINVEHVDEGFLKKRFKHDHGNLWKCTYPADLADLGDNPESYKFTPSWNGEQRVYELKTNETADDYSAIRDLCHTVGSASDAEFQCALESVFDVDGFLKLAAIEMLVGHWDNYIGNQNNFYLYERPSDGRLMMFSYDVDNTLGIEWGGNWANQNVYDYDQWGTKPLYDRMMGVEQYRTRLGWYIRDLIDNGDFSGTAWLERGNTLLNLCLPAALEDTYRTLDYGFDNDDYLNCLTSGSGGHVTQGIAENVNARATSAYSQTSDAQFPRDIQAWVYTPVVDDTLRVKAEAAGTPLSVQLHLSVDGGGFNTYAMNDDGLSGDGLAGDARFGLKVHLPNTDQVSWYTSATYSDGAQPTDPCVPGQAWISLTSDVPFRLNEVMAQNTSYITDEAGGFADWVELVNVGDEAADVTGLVLTNRRSEPQRYAFPAATVAAGDHQLVWLDNDPEEGPFHASFNIESNGDDLILSVWDTFGWRCVDQIDWATPQLSNTSLGRVTDGAAEWTTFVPNTSAPPTPDAANAGPTGNPCPEDLDGDGAVGVSDVLMVLGEFGCASNCTMDIDGDQSVGVSDVLAVLSVFGELC